MNESLGSLVGYDSGPKELKQCGSDESILGNLKRKQARLQEQLTNVNNAISALETDPKLLTTLELLQRAIRS